jgi:hypothetical protein
MECKFSTCAYYSALTALFTILSFALMYVLFVLYNRTYLEKYHSADLVRWREEQLARI